MAVFDIPVFTFIVVCITAVSLQCSEAFVFSDDCPAPAPCSCSGISGSALIMCSNKHLTSVPVFHSSKLHTKEIIVFLNNNNLTTIRNYSFRSLSTMHASSIQMQLESNAIFNIDQFAFEGIEDSITILQLQNNGLTSIPSAVLRLWSLDYLDVSNNPLQSLGFSSMSGLGQSLKTLYIDLSPFNVWPPELVFLKNLKGLTISSMSFERINSSQFQGFENTLEALTIKHAPNLRNIPCALTTLPKLKSFSLEHAGQLETTGVISVANNCSKQSHSVTTFTLENSNLTSFPGVLNNFPTTTSLNLRGNSLQVIEMEKAQSTSRLTLLPTTLEEFRPL